MLSAVPFAAALGAMIIGAAAMTTWLRVRRAQARYPPSGRMLTIDGYRYHCRMAGCGPPLVLLHGSGASGDDWNAISKALAAEFTTIVIDRPGHGHSERPPGDIGNPAAQAGIVHQLLQQLGVAQAIMVGHSWSGALALAYALAFPNEVRGVVVVQGTVYPEPGLVNRLLALLTKPVIGRILAYTITPWLGRRRIDETLRRAFAPQSVPAAYRRQALAMWLRPRQARAIAADTLGRHAAIGDLSARYPELRCPMALVIGEADGYIDPARQALALARVIPRATLHLVPGAGHQLPLTHPEAVATAIREFAQRLNRQGD